MGVFISRLRKLDVLHTQKNTRISFNGENNISLSLNSSKLQLTLTDDLNYDVNIISKHGKWTEVNFKRENTNSSGIVYINRYSKCNKQVLTITNTTLCDLEPVKNAIYDTVSDYDGIFIDDEVFGIKANLDETEEGIDVTGH